MDLTVAVAATIWSGSSYIAAAVDIQFLPNCLLNSAWDFPAGFCVWIFFFTVFIVPVLGMTSFPVICSTVLGKFVPFFAIAALYLQLEGAVAFTPWLTV